jgi:hypothetical protein
VSQPDTRIDIAPAVALLNRSVHLFRRGSNEGVRLLAAEVAGALATATKVAPKTRPIVARAPGKPQRPGTWYAKRVHKSNVSYPRIKAETKQQARMERQAIISRRGLARSAWFWMLRDVGGGTKSVPGATVRKTGRAYAVRREFAGSDPAILLHSRLNYASDAFKTKGRATVYNVGARAAGRVSRTIARRLKKYAP